MSEDLNPEAVRRTLEAFHALPKEEQDNFIAKAIQNMGPGEFGKRLAYARWQSAPRFIPAPSVDATPPDGYELAYSLTVDGDANRLPCDPPAFVKSRTWPHKTW